MGRQRLADDSPTPLKQVHTMNAFQDHYPENVAHCYGCGHQEIKGRKVVVEATVYAADVATACGEVVAVQMPDSFGQTPTQK